MDPAPNTAKRLILLGLVAFAAGCGVGAHTSPAEEGATSVRFAARLNLATAVDSATVTVWTMDGTALLRSSLDRADTANGWTLWMSALPAPATYRFTIEGYDAAGMTIYLGETYADVKVGTETKVAIVAQTPAAPPQSTQLPVITAVSASAMPVPSLGSASFAVVAESAQPLLFAWQDSCGGTFAAPTAATTPWMAPAFTTPPVDCVVVVSVSDGTSSVTTYIPVTFQ